MNWRELADEAYARAAETADLHARQALRTIGDIYSGLDQREGGPAPAYASSPTSELLGAAEEAKHRVEEAISKLENGVDALRKLKVKSAEEHSGREN